MCLPKLRHVRYCRSDSADSTGGETKQASPVEESIPNTTHHLQVADNILFSFDKQIFDTCNSFKQRWQCLKGFCDAGSSLASASHATTATLRGGVSPCRLKLRFREQDNYTKYKFPFAIRLIVYLFDLKSSTPFPDTIVIFRVLTDRRNDPASLKMKFRDGRSIGGNKQLARS